MQRRAKHPLEGKLPPWKNSPKSHKRVNNEPPVMSPIGSEQLENQRGFVSLADEGPHSPKRWRSETLTRGNIDSQAECMSRREQLSEYPGKANRQSEGQNQEPVHPLVMIPPAFLHKSVNTTPVK
ncbi:hypothetical protein PTTG_26168 [Puccinia triticina 1-1 BBBD Race 1]|uniref:Uncharacterized protein n=2 Tax=Puccinia triticina TaxID=208348 RepID=A0A180GWH1_PUCT1|nr:uncharacterized protein PtA15_6A719 [Puccinia triticina]OAV97177.1 hypothetical protein PTTG_26168 [Puccinia triticina 1-1 BBBD Race 1]WAQ86089.1 hypothetical protein PtA15_6A719 [Puccinia triticina]WAR55978.1 hypothetical protein PtB15_6B722 [Puccinia triticina]